MSNKLKSLSLALIAVFALGVVVASSASAATSFTSEKGATITGEQTEGKITEKTVKTHEFTTKAGTVKCTTATFHGVALANESPEQTLSPTYSGCTLAGGVPVHVKMNECDYLFTAGDTIAGSSSTITATADVKCPNGKVIEVAATESTCVITIGAQNGLGAIELHNAGNAAKMEIEATIDVVGIAYETHGSCPNSPTPTVSTTDGSYRGLARLHSNTASGVTVH